MASSGRISQARCGGVIILGLHVFLTGSRRSVKASTHVEAASLCREAAFDISDQI